MEAKTAKTRLYFIDNLRWVMIILVVLIHINVTYSGIGGWYYVEQSSSNLDTISKVVCGLFGMFTQAFFMGFLFFIAGYFVPGSYDKKGPWKFISDRFIRLGIPVLIYMFIVNPFILHYLLDIYRDGRSWTLSAFYIDYIKQGKFIGGTGPLWFAMALFIFSLVYTAVRIAGVRPVRSCDKTISVKTIVYLILVVSIVTFAVRLYFPFGTDVFNMQLCFFTQYIVIFTAGIISYRRKLLLRIPYEFGVKWLKYGVSIGMLLWIIMIIAGGALNGNENALFGGMYWQSAAYATWESIICASMSLGLLVIFRERFNRHNKLTKLLSDNAFGVYAFHPPLLIFISLLLRHIKLYPILKIWMVAIIAIPVVFIFSHIIRKIPVIKKLYS